MKKIKEISHVIMNADTDYDAEMILRDFIESLAKEVEGEEEKYSGGLERFEENENVDMEKLVFAHSQAIKKSAEIIRSKLTLNK